MNRRRPNRPLKSLGERLINDSDDLSLRMRKHDSETVIEFELRGVLSLADQESFCPELVAELLARWQEEQDARRLEQQADDDDDDDRPWESN